MDKAYSRTYPSSSPMTPQTQSTAGVSVTGNGGGNDQELIEHAARNVDKMMNRDLSFPSLYKSLTQIADPAAVLSGMRPVSGFMEYDYPPVVQRRIVTESQFTVIHNTPIPNELNDLLNQADVQYCHMGLFPEIYRAWMTIDSDLYLWDLRDGSDLSFFDWLKEPIITMSLVPAKSNVFQNTIKHLLCVITASEIVFLGFVTSDSPNCPVIEVVPQPVFILSTEGVTFNVVHGTKKGRVFLGGHDGSIHEVNYQAEKGWMSDRCWKTNHTRSYFSSLFKFITMSLQTDPVKQIVSDDLRNILFVRTVSGGLQVFDLGFDGTGFSRSGYMTFEGVVNEVVNISKKTLESNVVKTILTIAPVTEGEINLIAALDNGIRLYFSCYNPPTSITRSPNYFHLVHVRMPPGYCTSTAMPKPSIAHLGYSAPGIFALSSRTAQDDDCLWLINPFMYPSSFSSEVFSIQIISGRALEIKVIPPTNGEFPLIPEQENLPDIITQHLNWHRDIVVLTSNGTSVFRAHKPYEILKNVLAETRGAETLRAHFEAGVSIEQPLANACLLSIHPSTRSEPTVLELAVKAFFMFGDSRNWMENNQFETTMDFNPNLVSTPRQDSFGRMQSPYASPRGLQGSESGYNSPPVAGSSPFGQPQSHYGTPIVPSSSQQNPQQNQFQEQFSPRHDAIYVVVGRILHQFWNRVLVNTGTVGTGLPPIITPNIQGQEVTQAIIFLQNMSAFINNNPPLYMSRVNMAMINPNTADGRQLYSQELEKNSIIALKSFISLTLEVLQMWKILCDHQFHIVFHGMDTQLQNLTMRELVINGQSSVSVIINALISKYLGDNAAVDAISLRLREVCPTLFKSEDAIGSKVAEILSKVKNTNDRQEKDLLLKESLVLAEKICGHGHVNIRGLCKQYAELGFPVGAVRLCASAAKAADPDKLALGIAKTTSTSSDSFAMQTYQTRVEIYRIVFDLLNNYVHLAASSQSPLLKNTEDRITPQTAQHCAEETIHSILSSDDEMFHISLYNWLLEKKEFDRLLEIKHPYLDAFLQRAADAVVSGKWSGVAVVAGGTISANDTRVLDLLWRHHEMNQNHAAAAQILSKLAESTTTGLNLKQRLDYMSRAIICSKSCSRRGDLLESLEDKVEVAEIQKNILDSINAKLNTLMNTRAYDEEVKMLQDACVKLNSQLFGITSLYTDFAQPFKLNDAKLEIFYSAGHGDKQTIESVWSEIIDEELSSQSSGTRSIQSQMQTIRQKVVTLGRKYKTSPTYFPVEFLVEHLETMKPADSEDVTWVFKIMLDVGLNFSDLLNLYETLWNSIRSRTDAVAPGDLQIARVIITMIDYLAREELELKTTLANRPDLLENCKEIISKMIVEFSSRFDVSSTELRHSLARVRERLDRMSFS